VLILSINPAQFLANDLEYTVVLVDSFRISSLREGSVQGYRLQREALQTRQNFVLATLEGTEHLCHFLSM